MKYPKLCIIKFKNRKYALRFGKFPWNYKYLGKDFEFNKTDKEFFTKDYVYKNSFSSYEEARNAFDFLESTYDKSYVVVYPENKK